MRPGRFPGDACLPYTTGPGMPGPYRAAKKDIRPFTSRCPFLIIESFFVYFLLEESKSARLLADVGEDAAVNVQDQAVDKVRSLRCQEDGGAAQILGLAPAGSRSLGNDELIERMTAAIGLDLTQRCGLRGSDVARARATSRAASRRWRTSPAAACRRAAPRRSWTSSTTASLSPPRA